jgi:hypothetical protein
MCMVQIHFTAIFFWKGASALDVLIKMHTTTNTPVVAILLGEMFAELQLSEFVTRIR